MKRLFTHNWQVKLVSLILAFAVWYLIKKNITDDTYRKDGAPFSQRVK